jgi:hypothetical protein
VTRTSILASVNTLVIGNFGIAFLLGLYSFRIPSLPFTVSKKNKAIEVKRRRQEKHPCFRSRARHGIVTNSLTHKIHCHCCSYHQNLHLPTEPTVPLTHNSTMTTSRSIYVLFVSALLLADTAGAWSMRNPFHRRRQRAARSPTLRTPSAGDTNKATGSASMTGFGISTTTTTTTSNPSLVGNQGTPMIDSRLFYQNGVLSTSESSSSTSSMFVDVSSVVSTATTAVAAPRSTSKKPRSIFLPRRSPTPEQLQRQKMLLDVELVIGRFAMVTAILFVVGEVMSGLGGTMDHIIH